MTKDDKYKWVKNTIAVLVIGTFLYYLYTVRSELISAAKTIELHEILLLFLCLAVQWGMRALRDQRLFFARGHRPNWLFIYWMMNVQVVLNHLPLKAGTLSNAGALKSRFGIRYQDYLVCSSQQYLLLATVSGFCLAFVLPFLPSSPYSKLLVLVGFSMGVFALLLMFISRPLQWFERWLPEIIKKNSRKIALFPSSPGTAILGLGLTAGILLITALRMVILFSFFNVNLSILPGLVVSSAQQLSVLASITPGGIGISESFVGASSALLKVGASVGLMAASLDRVAILFTSTLLGVCLAPFHGHGKQSEGESNANPA